MKRTTGRLGECQVDCGGGGGAGRYCDLRFVCFFFLFFFPFSYSNFLLFLPFLKIVFFFSFFFFVFFSFLFFSFLFFLLL